MLKEYRTIREKRLEAEKSSDAWFAWNKRYLDTYQKILGQKFGVRILDLGCGSGEFVTTANRLGFEAIGIDADRADFEKDKLPYQSGRFNVVHFNAVLEHLSNPENIFREIGRVLKSGGVLIINTPNWQMDFKNFYNDPTHKKPYTPKSLAMLMEIFGFKVIFLEPALINHPSFFWKVPNFFKWRLAKYLPRGTRSILCIGEKW